MSCSTFFIVCICRSRTHRPCQLGSSMSNSGNNRVVNSDSSGDDDRRVREMEHPHCGSPLKIWFAGVEVHPRR